MPPLAARHLGGLAAKTRAALRECLRLQLEDGTVAPLRDNYVEQMWSLIHNEDGLDEDWLCCTTREVYFKSRGGHRLVVHLRDEAPAAEVLHLVVDQSGSMANVQESVYTGARELVQDMPDDAQISFSTFASSVSLGDLTSKEAALAILQQPRTAHGSTALYDAIVQVTERCGTTAGSVTIAIVTDGQDTCSRRGNDAAQRAIQAFRADPLRSIVFLGSNQDALASATAIGIPVTHALSMGNQPVHMREGMRALSANLTRRRTGDVDGFLESERSAQVV